jgi:two-component system NtrC family sensor kinase
MSCEMMLTIRQRTIIVAVSQAVLICIICAFVYFSFRTIVSKLRTIEIIADLNISVLEMRKAEKNFFLYKDNSAILELITLGKEELKGIQGEKNYISSNLGQKTYNDFEVEIKQYVEMANVIRENPQKAPDLEDKFRSLGHKLTRLFALLLKKERKNVNHIIMTVVVILIIVLSLLLLFQLVLWRYFSRLIIHELASMEPLITKVSEGRFHEVAVAPITPHNEIRIAIKAIADMARELEKREGQLLQSEKLASLGVLISGVAHELGNPLNNISLMAQTYLSIYDMLGDEEKKTFMGDILNQSERIRKIIQNLLDFSRLKKQELEEQDPGKLVEISLGLVTNHMKLANVKVHKTIAPALPRIFVDAPQLEQVMVNLCINAIQAMPQGGDLFVEVDRDQQNEAVVIKVRDTGSGIPQDILPNIFDPFFSTKGTKGTGLGLSVSYGIIRQHDGEITVESQENRGTTFTIKLPCHGKQEGGADGERNYRN